MSKEAAPQPLEQDGAEFTFADHAKGATFQAVLKRPVTVAAITLIIAVGVFVGFSRAAALRFRCRFPRFPIPCCLMRDGLPASPSRSS